MALWGCSGEVTIKTTDQEPSALDSLLEAYYQTLSDRDWEAYRAFFWENATLTTVWQQPGDTVESVMVSTIDEFIAKTPEGPDSQPIFEETRLHTTITTRDDLASAWVKYKAKFGTEENLMEWRGTDLFSLMQHNGEWRIVALVFSQDEH